MPDAVQQEGQARSCGNRRQCTPREVISHPPENAVPVLCNVGLLFEGKRAQVPLLGPLLFFWGYFAWPISFSCHALWVFAGDPGTWVWFLGCVLWTVRSKRRPQMAAATVSAAPVLLFAAGVYVWSTGLVAPAKFRPLEFPASLHVGVVESPEFEPGHTGRHWIVLEVDRGQQDDDLECLLGLCNPCPAEHCEGITPVVNIRWRVVEGDAEVASGTSRETREGSSWSSTLGKGIGWFDAREGHTYDLHLDILTDGDALNNASPRVLVENPVQFLTSALIMSGLMQLGSLFLIGLASVILAARYWPALVRGRRG